MLSFYLSGPYRTPLTVRLQHDWPPGDRFGVDVHHVIASRTWVSYPEPGPDCWACDSQVLGQCSISGLPPPTRSLRSFARYCSTMNPLFRASKELLRKGARGFAAGPATGKKVTILGAAGGIGQPLSLLMKVRLPITGYSDLKDLGFSFKPAVWAVRAHMIIVVFACQCAEQGHFLGGQIFTLNS
jgi:hypothetical protein